MEHGDLGAVVSKIDHAKLSPSSSDVSSMLAFERVVEALHQECSVLPVRFGCLVESEAQVIELLYKHHAPYRAAIEELQGNVEFGIRILLPAKNSAPGNRRPHYEVRGLNLTFKESCPGKAYLVSRKVHYTQDNQLTKKENLLAQRCKAAFTGLYIKCKREQDQFPPMTGQRDMKPGDTKKPRLLSLYFLVKKQDEKKFRKAFKVLRQQEAFKTLLTGPWPPYNFVPSIPDSL